MVDWGNVPSWISAIISFLALISAVAAVAFAYRQLELAKTLREEKARPFVVVDIETAAGPGHPFTELVIRNIGETLARNVKITFEPPLRTTLDDPRYSLASSALIKEGVPSMPPGREYRVLFEQMPDRYARTDLPRRYTVTVELSGRRGPEEPLTQILDLNIFYGVQSIENNGIHHIAKTLRSWAKSSGVSNF